MGVLEIAASRFWDPNSSLADIHPPEANTDLSCIREGGYRNLRDYKVWEWSVPSWLQRTMAEQIQFESSTDSVNIWLALDGYCIHLDGTDIFYGLKHAEVLGDTLNPRRVLNQMRAATLVEKENRPTIFSDTTINRRQSVILPAINLMVGASQARQWAREAEGATPVERTTMRVKDQA